jgi:hypothetical protein
MLSYQLVDDSQHIACDEDILVETNGRKELWEVVKPEPRRKSRKSLREPLCLCRDFHCGVGHHDVKASGSPNGDQINLVPRFYL